MPIYTWFSKDLESLPRLSLIVFVYIFQASAKMKFLWSWRCSSKHRVKFLYNEIRIEIENLIVEIGGKITISDSYNEDCG